MWASSPWQSKADCADLTLGNLMQLLLKDDTQVYKQFVKIESCKRSVSDIVLANTS